ncbi:MAG TPA: hypothetical protein VG818_09625 [Gemmatimonadaceae bacterium]|nr:hypothetical protein [Gemmatimonadaceae bacterium]
MRLLLFAAVICGSVATAAGAQEVPARDLLEFPLGALAEAPALASQLSGGLWNPASVTVWRPERVAVGAVALNSPIEQGVSAQLAAASVALPRDFVVSASLARASVTDLIRTETDPQSIGSEIPYGTTLFSVGLARRFSSVTAGTAIRYRTGTADYLQRGAVSLDWGVVADRVLGSPVRVAASTFLLSPTPSREAATWLAAADAPVVSRDSVMQVRLGLSASATHERGNERYLYASIRYANVEARGGIARVDAFGGTSDHSRLGLSMRYGRYGIGISREEQGAGLGGVYQFALTSVFP